MLLICSYRMKPWQSFLTGAVLEHDWIMTDLKLFKLLINKDNVIRNI